MKRFEVRSDKDGEIAFSAETVDYEARVWRTTARKAADRIARENNDITTSERLFVVAV